MFLYMGHLQLIPSVKHWMKPEMYCNVILAEVILGVCLSACVFLPLCLCVFACP